VVITSPEAAAAAGFFILYFCVGGTLAAREACCAQAASPHQSIGTRSYPGTWTTVDSLVLARTKPRTEAPAARVLSESPVATIRTCPAACPTQPAPLQHTWGQLWPSRGLPSCQVAATVRDMNQKESGDDL
jgi:hypothetical protein